VDVPGLKPGARSPTKEEESLTLKKKGVLLAGLLVATFALVAAGCGGDSGGGAPEALP